jgi:hypothetical protein
MGNVLTSGLAFVLSIVAAVFSLRAWRKTKGVPKKWFGIAGIVLLIPGLLLLLAIIAIIVGGVGLFLIRIVLGISVLTLFIGTAFIIYATIVLSGKEDKTEDEKSAINDGIIATLVSGIGSVFILITFFLKIKGKEVKSPSLPSVPSFPKAKI